jgi:hypothetical protein
MRIFHVRQKNVGPQLRNRTLQIVDGHMRLIPPDRVKDIYHIGVHTDATRAHDLAICTYRNPTAGTFLNVKEKDALFGRPFFIAEREERAHYS